MFKRKRDVTSMLEAAARNGELGPEMQDYIRRWDAYQAMVAEVMSIAVGRGLLLGSIPVIEDPTVPPGVLRFEQDGRVVGAIVNVRVEPEDDREIRHPFE